MPAAKLRKAAISAMTEPLKAKSAAPKKQRPAGPESTQSGSRIVNNRDDGSIARTPCVTPASKKTHW